MSRQPKSMLPASNLEPVPLACIAVIWGGRREISAEGRTRKENVWACLLIETIYVVFYLSEHLLSLLAQLYCEGTCAVALA